MKNFKEFQVNLFLFAIVSVLSANQVTITSESTNQLNSWARSHLNESQRSATNLAGIPIPSLTASQALGSSGPILLQDSFLLEKTASFNRERIPERVVNAKGAGATGYFIVTHDISRFTKAKFLNEIGKNSNVVVRFSTVSGESGSADTLIDSKGFAVKFLTEEGNHDLVGSNIEVFPIRDPMLFSDLSRSRKRNPQTHLKDPTAWWDFVSLRPETTLHMLHLFSDIGTPMGYRGMNGAGVHTFKMVNSSGSLTYVKFHWKSHQQKKTLTKVQSAIMTVTEPDFAIQDLYDAIGRKEYPSWDLLIQVMTLEQLDRHPLNPFDVTKHWRREQYPLIPVGTMTLDQNPKNYFASVEQVAFSPSAMVPGIEASPDRMLHARMFAYSDAQRYRLGANFAQLPVNMPVSPLKSYSRDGASCHGSNGEGGPNYYPNSYHGIKQNPSVQQTKFSLYGDAERIDTGEQDNFSQAKLFLERDVTFDERQRIVDNIADFLRKADKEVQERFLRNNAYPISNEFGDMIKQALYGSLPANNLFAENKDVSKPTVNYSPIPNTIVGNENANLNTKNDLAQRLQQNKDLLAKLTASKTNIEVATIAPQVETKVEEEEERW